MGLAAASAMSATISVTQPRRSRYGGPSTPCRAKCASSRRGRHQSASATLAATCRRRRSRHAPAAPPSGVGRSSALPLHRRPVRSGELQEAGAGARRCREERRGRSRGGAGAGRGGTRGRERKGGERVTGEVEPVAAAETLAGRELLARRVDPRAEDEEERDER